MGGCVGVKKVIKKCYRHLDEVCCKYADGQNCLKVKHQVWGLFLKKSDIKKGSPFDQTNDWKKKCRCGEYDLF